MSDLIGECDEYWLALGFIILGGILVFFGNRLVVKNKRKLKEAQIKKVKIEKAKKKK